MIYFRPGSHVYRLVTMLSVVGELPTSSLHLLGTERVVKALVHELIFKQTFCNPATEEQFVCRLIGISGKGAAKTVRFHKSGLPILEWLHPDAPAYYMTSFYDHHFPGGIAHKDRNHRMAESAMMCMRAGAEFRPYVLPALQNKGFQRVIPESPSFYVSRSIKQVSEDDMDKISYSRLCGMLFGGNNAYAVYNTRNAVMKWNGHSEFKAWDSMNAVCRRNAGISEWRSAVLFGKSYDTALRILEFSDGDKRKDFRFDNVYTHTHFIPQTELGIRQLKLMLLPDWKERILETVFEEDTRSFGRGSFEYDACENGRYILAHFDGDIARLKRFRMVADAYPNELEVLCYPHQARFVRAYLGDGVSVSTVEMDALEETLFD